MRIFHGPVNIGGLGGYLASWQRQHGHDARFIVWVENRFMMNHDEVVFHEPPKSKLKAFMTKLRCAIQWAFRFDVFHFYFGSSLLPFSLDIPLLRLMGKRIVMTYCGSEARLVYVERKRNPYWHLAEGALKGTLDDARYDKKKILMLIWHGIWCHKIIAIRNQYESVSRYVPNHKIASQVWIHNISFSAEAFRDHRYDQASSDSMEMNVVPRVVHMPTSPAAKGTQYFRHAVDRLKEERLEFEYVEVTDTEHVKAIEELKKADIVLDQLLLGGFGSLSVEAMFLGKPVVCYLIEAVKQQHYPDCPIVNANVDDIKDRMKALLLDAELRRTLGQAGRRFVSDHFDYESINQYVLKLYQSG